MTSAVIVAAGKGTRMGSGLDKIFLEVAGLPVVGHAWLKFDRQPEIDEIVMVIREDAREQFEQLAGQLNLAKPHTLIAGGAERQDSVMNGLAAVHAECELVAIHDGARPCTSAGTISETLAAARETGAAVAARKVTDTLKLADDQNHIASNVDRTHHWTVQTPQIFRLEIIRAAMAAVREQGIIATDDTAACELISQPVTLVPSPDSNPKVTTPADLLWVELLLRQ
jgi:2-C-methyl-D-erythritol 4-phosphate cytidylyltransferase